MFLVVNVEIDRDQPIASVADTDQFAGEHFDSGRQIASVPQQKTDHSHKSGTGQGGDQGRYDKPEPAT